MEEMTARMQDVANRTEKETVSMRIITLVTMFFLPGTFISVSGSGIWQSNVNTDLYYRHS